MREETVKVTPQQFADVREKLRRAHLSNPWGADVLDDKKAKEILRTLGVEPKDDTTYRFVVTPCTVS